MKPVRPCLASCWRGKQLAEAAVATVRCGSDTCSDSPTSQRCSSCISPSHTRAERSTVKYSSRACHASPGVDFQLGSPKPNLGSSRADVLKIQVQPSARASVRSPTARTMHVHTIRSLASKLMHESNTAGRYLCAAARSACSETLSKVLVVSPRWRHGVRSTHLCLPRAVRYARGAALLMRRRDVITA